jgi:hypothetical protein
VGGQIAAVEQEASPAAEEALPTEPQPVTAEETDSLAKVVGDKGKPRKGRSAALQIAGLSKVNLDALKVTICRQLYDTFVSFCIFLVFRKFLDILCHSISLT